LRKRKQQLQIRHYGAVGLVDRLAAQGLIAREHSEADLRQIHVMPTEKWLAILEQLTSMHKEELRRMLPEFQRLVEQISTAKLG